MTDAITIPSTNERIKGAITNLISLLMSHTSPTDPIVQSVFQEAHEAQKLLDRPKSGGITPKMSKEAWEDFIREKSHSKDPMEMFRHSELGKLPEDQKRRIVRKMQEAFEAALFSDMIAGCAERDAIHLFEAMGMPENVAMYLWREKDSCRRSVRHDNEIRDVRKHREALSIEIMRWALSPNKDEILDALAKFFIFKPEAIPEEVRKDMKQGKREATDCPPLMSESFLYPLFGKEDARSVLARMRGLLRALGLDEMEVWKRAKRLKGDDD